MMNRIIVLMMFVCSFSAVYSQEIRLEKKDYDKLVLDKDKLKADNDKLQAEGNDLRDSIAKIVKNHDKKCSDLNNRISRLDKEKAHATEEIAHLNKKLDKSNLKNLEQQINALQGDTANLKRQLVEKEKQIVSLERIHEQKVKDAKEKGGKDALASIVNSYKNKKFDDLIRSLNKQAVARDRQLVGNDAEIKPILNDLSVYFDAVEVLSKKFDASGVKNMQTQLARAGQRSALFNKQKEYIEGYQMYNDALKETLGEIQKKDKTTKANDSNTQKMKFQQITAILADYIYNYSDYVNYPYLSNVVFEVIQRKGANANADISDLLKKL